LFLYKRKKGRKNMLNIAPVSFTNNLQNYSKTNQKSKKEFSFNQTKPVSFGDLGIYRADIERKQILPKDTYFIRLFGYDRNMEWAEKMNRATYKLSDMISEKKDFCKILNGAETIVGNINNKNGEYIENFGVINIDKKIFSIKRQGRGREYHQRYIDRLKDYIGLNEKYLPKSNEEYKDAQVCSIEMKDDDYIFPYAVVVEFPHKYGSKGNLGLVEKEYNKLLSIENPTTNQILKTAATIQWLIAQDSPYKRGSDSIANLITKSLMHSYGIEISPVKEGVSLDFEAFYTDLDEYIEKYPTFFEKIPEKVI